MSIIARRAAEIGGSATLSMDSKIRELRQAGRNIISLVIGELNFDTPSHIKQAAARALEQGDTRYTNVSGTPELKQAIANKFRTQNGLEYHPRQIIVSNGSKQVISQALLATLEDGDEVIIPAPHWVSYPEMVHLAGARAVIVDCPAANGFKLSASALEAAVTERTKWLILNSPNNPSGATYTRWELEDLGQVLLRHPQVWVLSDNIYEHLTYDEHLFCTMAQVAPALYARTLSVNGVSKAYAMTGWRIGYAGGPVELIEAMEKLQSQFSGCACSISQAAAAAALQGTQDPILAWKESLIRRRDFVVNSLNRSAVLDCFTPDGAFYVFPSCAGAVGKATPAGKIIASDFGFAEFLLEFAEVAVVPGTVFGKKDHFVRISYATCEEDLTEACGRIQRACGELLS